MGAGASLKKVQVAESMAKSKGDSAEGEDPLSRDEAFYQAHKEELLEMLRGSQAKLQPRSEGGVGLLNQGATCYMNSLLQSLYNIPEFRLAVYNFEHLPELHGEASRCIPLQLQRLFAELQLLSASATSTKELTVACGFTGRDAMEQHDVQELCRVLFDALERSSSVLASVIQNLFSGKMTNYTRCKEERQGRIFESRRPASFMDLQVPIQDCKNLEEALKQLVEPSELSGDNRWFCEELGEKVDALSGTTIDSLPKILCLQLLRFIFDVQLMRRKKLSDSLAIPLELDASCLGGQGSYQLSAVCLHSGTAHGGHYHAFIRDLHSGVWKDANDSRVSLLGQRQCDALFANEGSGRVLYSSDAYFLLYRKLDMTMPGLEELVVPPPLSQRIEEENQRLRRLQRVYELHRRLAEVKVCSSSSGAVLQRRFMAQQLRGLVEPETEPEAEDMHTVSFSTLDSRPDHILQKASESFSEHQTPLDEAFRSTRLWHFDPLRGVATKAFTGCDGRGARLDLILAPEGVEPQSGELLLLLFWDSSSPTLTLQHTASIPWCKAKADEEPAKVQATEVAEEPPPDEDEMPDIFNAEMPVRSTSSSDVCIRDVRLSASKRWNLPLDSTVLVALTGMQAGQELQEDTATLRECGLSPDDILCVERFPREGGLPTKPRASELYDLKRNTAKMFFNHPDRPDFTEEFPPITISKDQTLAELKAQIAEVLGLEAQTLHLAKTSNAISMFKDESRTLRQVGLGEVDTVVVGHGAPCDPNEKLLKVFRYVYDNGNHKVFDAFNFPAAGEMSVRSLKEALLKVCIKQWELPPEVTWKRFRLRDGQAGKQYAILRDQRTLRSALLGFADGRQVAVQLMEEEEELGPDDMLLLLRPWRVMEGRLHAPTEIVASKHQSLRDFRAKLTERYKGLLQDAKDETDKENQPDGVEDMLEIMAAHATGPPMTVKRCETLKWSESRLNEATDQTLADLKELRDGVTLIVRSRLAALRGAQVDKVSKGTGKGPSAKGPQGRKGGPASPTAPKSVTVAVAKGRAERGLVIQVAHPEAEEQAAAPLVDAVES